LLSPTSPETSDSPLIQEHALIERPPEDRQEYSTYENTLLPLKKGGMEKGEKVVLEKVKGKGRSYEDGRAEASWNHLGETRGRKENIKKSGRGGKNGCSTKLTLSAWSFS
jgi:hypothetical protein